MVLQGMLSSLQAAQCRQECVARSQAASYTGAPQAAHGRACRAKWKPAGKQTIVQLHLDGAPNAALLPNVQIDRMFVDHLGFAGALRAW